MTATESGGACGISVAAGCAVTSKGAARLKLHMFHLMPYRELPQDFDEKYRSVWVDVPAPLMDPVKVHQMYNDTLDELEYAAALGYDGICVNEHHQNAYGFMPSPNMMAAIPGSAHA